MHTHVYSPPSRSFLVSPLSLLCFGKQSRGKPRRTLQHLSSKVGSGHNRFALTMLTQHKIGKTDYAWESDMLCSLYTPPTNLSIVKMGGWGSMKTLHPTWQGPIWETGVFTIDTWPLLQKYWLRRPDIHWMALKGCKERFFSGFDQFSI